MKKAKTIILFLFVMLGEAHAEPQYILIKQKLTYGWKFIHVSKPKNKLHKWYYDSKNDTYYRMRNSLGMGIRITQINKK